MSLDAASLDVVALEPFDALIAAGEKACDAAKCLIEHREGFLKDSEELAGRGFVLAGKSVNLATALGGVATAVGGMLLPAAAVAAAPVIVVAGIGLGVVGAGSSIAATAHDNDIDARCADVLRSVPDFFKKDEQLREGLQTLYQDFRRLMEIQQTTISKCDGAASQPLDASLMLSKAGTDLGCAVANIGAAAAAADVAGDMAQAVTKVAFCKGLGFAFATVGACFAFKDLWDAASKRRSWAGLRQEVSKSTEEVRRLRKKLRNFVDLAGMLETASPPPQQDANLGRLLAHALTQDMKREDMFEWAALELESDIGEVLRFDNKTSRIYSLQPGSYGKRGGRTYFKPSGWVRYSREIPNFEKYADWCVAYHGTRPKERNIYGEGTRGVQMRLLLQGLRAPLKPRDQGQAGSETGRTMYVSPSIEYAAQYSNFIRTASEVPHWVQVVFQCRVRPGNFDVQPSTLQSRWHENRVRHDPNFKNSELEWLIENEDAVVISGMMVREFGPAADPSIYGEMATKVREGITGEWGNTPFHHWMRMRSEEMLRLTAEKKVPFP